MPRSGRTPLGYSTGADPLTPRRLIISPEEEEALPPGGGFCFSLKGGGECGGERFASERNVSSKGLVALVTA